MGEQIGRHYFDARLAEALAEFFAGGSVADLGCGEGRYVRHFRQRGLTCDGFDGNPDTPRFEPSCQVLDLSRPVQLGRLYDWVLSLEVGEHLPAVYEEVFLDTLHRHNRLGIVLSWAVPGQGGHGHVNERPNWYLRARLSARGYAHDPTAEQRLRAAATYPWFPNTLMVFRRTREVRLRELEREPRIWCDETHPLLHRINRVGGLIDLLHCLPQPLRRVAEVGSFRGVSTEVLLLFSERVTAVEPRPVEAAFRHLAACYPGLDVVREASPAAARHVPDGALDLVYIDGDHNYEPVKADLLAWLPKVRPGGWVAGHDYTTALDQCGVVRAVNEVFGKPLRVFSDTSWLVAKP
jgi:SAM-dependent methyltransferase